jgi:hypothetical protein
VKKILLGTKVSDLKEDSHYYMEPRIKQYSPEIIKGRNLISLAKDSPFFFIAFDCWNLYELENTEEFDKYRMVIELMK